jgi:hypothetical protein
VTRARNGMAAVIAALGMLALGMTPAALAAGVGKQRAAALAKRAASARVERFGISYPRARGRPRVTAGRAAGGAARSARAVSARVS